MKKSSRYLSIFLLTLGASSSALLAQTDAEIYAELEPQAFVKETTRDLKLTGPLWKRIAPLDVTPSQTFALCVAINPNKPQEMLLGVRPQGMYKSTDGGKTWERTLPKIKTDGNVGVNPDSIFFHPKRPNIAYIGYEISGFFRTVNLGERLRRANKGLVNLNIISIATNPKNPRILYAGTDNGLHRSTDGGNNWTMIHTPENGLPRYEQDSREVHPTVQHILFDPFDPKTIYITFLDVASDQEAGVYISRDGGENWKASNQGIETGYAENPNQKGFFKHQASGYVVAADLNKKGTFYFGSGVQGIFKSTDHGRSWKPVNDKAIGVHGQITAVATNPKVSGHLFAGTHIGLVYESKDGGANWKLCSNGLRFGKEPNAIEYVVDYTLNNGTTVKLPGTSREFLNKVEKLVFAPDGKTLYAACSAGLYALSVGE